MKKSFLCLSAAVLLLFSAGCISSGTSGQDPWRNIKADELIGRQEQGNKSMTVGLHIYLFQIRTNKLAQIQYQIRQTNELPVKYNDPNAFLANGLTGCAGDITSWQKIAPLLAQAKPNTKKHINLRIAENLTSDIIVVKTAQPVSVIYYSNGTTAGIGFDAGQTVLRIKASLLIGLRQACRLDITPVYKIIGPQPQKLQSGEKNREFTFDSAAFSVCLQPGQFVLIAPANEKQEQTEAQTIGNIMSYRQIPKNTADLYLVACNLVNTPL